MAVSKGALLFDYKSAGVSGTTGAQAVGVAIPVGSVIAVSVEGSGAAGPYTVGVSDSKSNTWTVLTEAQNNNTGGGFSRWAYCVVTAALTAADTITVTRSGGASNSLLAQARVLSDVDTATPVDVAGTTGTGNSTHPLGGAQSVHADSMTLGVGIMNLASITPTADAGFTVESSGASTSTGARSYASVSKANGTAGSVTAGFTAATAQWSFAQVTFRAAFLAASTGSVTISGSATLTEVEIVAPTGHVGISGSAALSEVEAIASTGSVTISGPAVTREVEIAAAAGSVTISGSAVVVLPTPATVTIEIGDWAQSWELGTDLDDDDLDMIALDGAVLDGLTASWSAADMLAQPEPVVVQFDVYVPETAAGPNLENGNRVHVLVIPPAYDEAGPDYDPMLEFFGRISDGQAIPKRDGLVYSVNAVDDLAGLGEVTLGGLDYPGDTVTTDDGTEQANVRIARITDELAALGIRLVHQWPRQETILALDTGDFSAVRPFYRGIVPMFPSSNQWIWPLYPERPGEGIPANEMLGQITLVSADWIGRNSSAGYDDTLNDYRDNGNFDLVEIYDSPRVTVPRRTYVAPYVVAGVDDDDLPLIRMKWSTPRVEGNTGLPLKVDTTGGVLSLVAKAVVDDEIPETSRAGAWIPASAVPVDGITWRVDKGAYPNRVTLAGYWVDWSPPQGRWYWYESKWIQQPERTRRTAFEDDPTLIVDKRLDTEFMNAPGRDNENASTDPPPNTGDPIAHAHLGHWSDSVPRYLVDGIEIRCEAIDPLAWPRLFPDPRRDEWNGGALGRFLFVYGMRPSWNPRRQAHYFGQLTGAAMTIESGKVRLNASLQQRRSGPNGGRPEDATPGTDMPTLSEELVEMAAGPRNPLAITWADTPTGSTIGDLTPLDTDPTITALDLWLTTAT